MATSYVGTNILPPFFGVQARTIRIHVAGAGDTSFGGSLKFDLYGGDGSFGSGILLGSTGNQNISFPDSKSFFSGIIYLTIYTLDSGGTCRVSGQILFGINGNTSKLSNWGFEQTSNQAFDATISHRLMLYSTFDTGGNRLQFNTVNIEVVA